MKLIIILLLLSSNVVAQKHPRYVQLVANRERIKHYVPGAYRLVRQTTSTIDGNVTEVPINMEIGFSICDNTVAYLLGDTQMDVKSYTLKATKVDSNSALYLQIRRYIKDTVPLTSWAIDGWIALCIKNDTLLMSKVQDDVTTIRYWKRQ